ncbi:MAG: 50S ribosomal protein L4 [Candidatus Eisenbacteria bacterium]|uniref:Large ribosomal subunit protein uL4 n=1 Tax=Eiseniibacteriota bacterium TaxID=2212470 RepID=A0A948W6H0_UNCEI|nr:50S ribosomal protein L4 [Candidatus Eisenbacteria bacterium]MBU2691120.1 50S ribosomal protein L4 [Candidatus Eisenbacteria bacterium]
MEARIFAPSGKELGNVELPEDIFSGPVKKHLIYEVIKGHLANQRQGTAKVKGRGEVRGGGRKPWRQKGTGRARSGTSRSPIWVGGGRAFGPKPRSYNVTLNRKMRRQALRSALIAKAKAQQLGILEDLSLPEPKTRHAFQMLKSMGFEGQRCLLVIEQYDPMVLRATGNLPKLRVTTWEWMNCHDVVNTDQVLMTKGALGKLAEAKKL